MSVNIFGSNGNKSSKSDDKYVDRQFINLTTNVKSKVDKNDDTMTGTLNMNDNKITTEYTPISERDVVKKKYVDTTLRDVDMGSKVNKAGDVMTSDFNMGLNKVISSHISTNENDLVNKKYIDSIPKAAVCSIDMDSKLL